MPPSNFENSKILYNNQGENGETYLCHQSTENATAIITMNVSVIKLQWTLVLSLYIKR